MEIVGIDIGGANIKAASTCGFVHSLPFPMWSRYDDLSEALSDVLRQAPPTEYLAVTITGELADCFETKDAGISHILNSLDQSDTRTARVYCTNGSWKTPDESRDDSSLVAASNWHALARLATALNGDLDKSALVLDIGSTTVDVVPTVNGQPIFGSATDVDRLENKSLVYAGIQRTPVCSIVNVLPFKSRNTPIAREVFATTEDAFIILGDLPEDSENMDTADGKPGTKSASKDRLARMICACPSEVTDEDAKLMSESIAESLASLIAQAINHQQSHHGVDTLLCTGHGGFLLPRIQEKLDAPINVSSLASCLTPEQLRCAPALAVATLLQQHFVAKSIT